MYVARAYFGVHSMAVSQVSRMTLMRATVLQDAASAYHTTTHTRIQTYTHTKVHTGIQMRTISVASCWSHTVTVARVFHNTSFNHNIQKERALHV